VVNVIPNYDVFIPNAFTPNGDGENDYWQIFGNLSAFKQVEIALFNRIGEKVFESKDAYFKWDGTYKGEKVPPGVYVYYAKFVWLNNHSDNKYTGSVTIIR
jgi:gliding motility-associated-like protein